MNFHTHFNIFPASFKLTGGDFGLLLLTFIQTYYTWFSDIISLDTFSGQWRKISYPRWIALSKAELSTDGNRMLEQPLHTLSTPTAYLKFIWKISWLYLPILRVGSWREGMGHNAGIRQVNLSPFHP